MMSTPYRLSWAAARAAFTLVELLVVISIIAILAALLLPVLGRAKYKTRVTTCVTQMRQVGISVTSYSDDWNGRYPVRQAATAASLTPSVNTLKAGPIDDRPTLRDYAMLNVGWYQCPLVAMPDGLLESSNRTYVLAAYSMWYGCRIRQDVPDSALMTVNDTRTWQGREYDILLSDYDRNWTAGVGNYNTAHPDSLGLTTLTDIRDIDANYEGRWYQNFTSNVRGKVDLNYARKDLSVFTLNALTIGDPRTRSLPSHSRPGWALSSTYLPPAN